MDGGSQPLGTTSIPAGYATWLSVSGPSIPSIKPLLVTIQGSWHRLTSTAEVASGEIHLLAQRRAPAMSLAGRLQVLSLTDTAMKLHFIFTVL